MWCCVDGKHTFGLRFRPACHKSSAAMSEDLMDYQALVERAMKGSCAMSCCRSLKTVCLVSTIFTLHSGPNTKAELPTALLRNIPMK